MKILVAVDGSESSFTLVHEVTRRPWPTGTEVTLLTVIEPFWKLLAEDPGDALAESAHETARNVLGPFLRELATCPGVDVQPRLVVGRPGTVIAEEAETWGADFIFVGSRGRGALGRLLLGSVALAVLRRAGCSVSLVRSSPAAAGSHGLRLLVATDGSEGSLAAARSVAARPWPVGSTVRVLAVAQPPIPLSEPWILPPDLLERLDADARREARSAANAAAAVLTSPSDRAGLRLASVDVVTGEPKACLLEACEAADLVVVGSHGRRGAERLLLGSVSESVALHAPCSVEVIRPA